MYTIYIYDIGSFGGPENEFYVCVSCQIYNDLSSDIEYLSNAILEIIHGDGGDIAWLVCVIYIY